MGTIKTPGEICRLLCENIDTTELIKHVNSISDREPGVDKAQTTEQQAGFQWTPAAKTWITENWQEFIELLRSYVFWYSTDVLSTKDKCKYLVDFSKKYPEIAEQIFNLDTFIKIDTINDKANWDTIERIVSKLQMIIKQDTNARNNLVYGKDRTGDEFFAQIRFLCEALSKVHHFSYDKTSALYNAEEVVDFNTICEWYLTPTYWTSLKYESLVEWHKQNADNIEILFKIAATAQNMITDYPVGLYPVFDPVANKERDVIIIGYEISKTDKDEVLYFLKCLKTDGSILSIKYSSHVTSETEETPIEAIAADIKEPSEDGADDNDSFGNWNNFDTGSVI